MIHPCGVHNRCSFVSKDTQTSVGSDGTVFLAVRNKTPLENITIQSKTVLGKAEPTIFVFEPIAIEQPDEASALSVEQTNRIHTIDLSDTSSEFSWFDQIFSSSTEMSEKGLSNNEKLKRTDPQLLNSFPSPNLFSVLSSWGKRHLQTSKCFK